MNFLKQSIKFCYNFCRHNVYRFQFEMVETVKSQVSQNFETVQVFLSFHCSEDFQSISQVAADFEVQYRVEVQ